MHFISISTDLIKLNASDGCRNDRISELADIHLKWLEHDLFLANENRFKVPWIVVTTHHSLYTSSSCVNTSSGITNYECFDSTKILRAK